MNPNLYGCRNSIITVDDSIQHRLSKCTFWHRKGFNTLNAFIADHGLEILGHQEIHRLSCLDKQAAVHLIVVTQVCFTGKVADLY